MKPTKDKKIAPIPPDKHLPGECLIPGAMPVEALAEYVLNANAPDADNIRSYIQLEAPDETVTHLEKLSSETIFGQQIDAWDVWTEDNRWWVITNPTNLYPQRLFPSLDYTISFHVGVTTRIAQRNMTQEELNAHDHINQLWNRLARARSTLLKAKDAEDFQSVGMKCRECLLVLVQCLARPDMVPQGRTPPQQGNFIDWSALMADHIARGDSSQRLRSYLKAISKETWHLVSWLTHAQHAGKFDGSIAVDATENVVRGFTAASGRNEPPTKKRNTRCPIPKQATESPD